MSTNFYILNFLIASIHGENSLYYEGVFPKRHSRVVE